MITKMLEKNYKQYINANSRFNSSILGRLLCEIHLATGIILEDLPGCAVHKGSVGGHIGCKCRTYF